jgi:hypothetical protein
MAYALKYTYTFKQIKTYTTEEWKLKIYLDGYGGSDSEINFIQKDSIKLSRDGDILENVLGTKLTFGIFNQTEGQFSEFRTAGWGDYKVELIKDPNGTPVTKFVGYNQSEIFTEPYDQPPYVSVLEFTCGLNHLKYIRFDNSGTLYTGQKTIIEVLRLALNKLPTPLNIREFNLIYEDSINSTTGDSAFNQIYVDPSVYKEEEDKDQPTEVGFFCWDVINEILKPFNAHIYIAEGKWQIWQPQGYQETTIYYREFIPRAGSESTVTVDFTGNLTTNKRTTTGADFGNANELVLVAPSTEMSIEPPLNRIKVTYNTDSLDIEDSNLIKNGCFEKRSNTAVGNNNYTTPSYWSFTGDDPSTYYAYYALNGTDDFFIFNNASDAQEEQVAIDTSIYMSQTKTGIPTSTADSLQFSFDFIFRANVNIASGGNINNSPSMFFYGSLEFVWEVEIKFGTYYLDGDADNGYSWTTLPRRATFKKQGFEDKGVVRSVYNFYEVFTIEQTLPTLPQNGIYDFSIKVYKPYSNWFSYIGTNSDFTFDWISLGQKCFKLVYLPNESPPPSELILYAKIDEDEKIEEIEVIHGDGLSTNTLNSFRLSTGEITDVWARRGKVETFGILDLLLRQLRDLRGGFVKILNGELIGEIEPYNSIQDATSSVEFWIRTYEYMVETNEWSVDLFELADYSAVSPTYSEETGVVVIGLDIDTSAAANGNDPISTNKIVGGTQSPIQSNQTNLTNYP